MDPFKSFEAKLLSGSLIDTNKLKQNRPLWLDPARIPRIYRDLEALVCIQNGTSVNGAQATLDTAKVYQVLLASGLSQQMLASIWDQCSKSVPGSLVRNEFYQALALVALCQAGNQPNVQLLANLQNAPIPQLAIAGYPLPLVPPGQPQSSQSVNLPAPDSTIPPTPYLETFSIQNGTSEAGAPTVDVVHRNGDQALDQQSVTNQLNEDEDDFADFQSAEPSAELPNETTAIPSLNNRISVPEFSIAKPVNEGSFIQEPAPVSNGREDSHHLVPTSHIVQNSVSQKSPKSTILASSPKQPKLLPSVSLFDSITVPVTENVQPPSENSPWLGFSIEPAVERPSKRVVKKDADDVLPIAPPKSRNDAGTASKGDGLPKGIDEEFDDFDDFQSAPVRDIHKEQGSVSEKKQLQDSGAPPNQDKYSVFRLLDESPPEPDADDLMAMPVNGHLGNDGELLLEDTSTALTVPPNESNGGASEDILSLIKLPSIPVIDSPLDDDLSRFDLLSMSSTNKVSDGNSSSALIELQDLDIGFTAVDGPVASHPSSVEVSPAKSVASGQSIGESRGGDHRLSIFTHKGNYAECASLSSFEMGPSTESNESSPTKGSVVSLELNSRSPPDDENADEDDTLEWTIETSDGPQVSAESADKQRKGSDEFCWAQPPMFPPPDPTECEKTSIPLSAGLFFQNFPETQKKKVTRQQVAEGWHRILSKAAAILESASVILGDDPVVLGEIISTPKGQSYISSLLEVYNMTQQLKKSAELHGVDGLSIPLQQVDSIWRGKLDDLATRLHLSVVCMDHLSSPIRVAEDNCAICSLPLNLRPPQILFGDNGYHSSCANFWANVLAEGLPCLKLSA